MHGQHPCDGNSLLLSSGKFVGRMFAVGIHPHSFQAFFHSLPDFLCGNAHVFRPESHILFHNLSDDLIIRILENHSCALTHIPDICLIAGVLAVHKNRSLCRSQKRIDVFGQCGFTGSVVPQNCNEFSLVYRKIHAVHGPAHTFYVSFFVTSYIFINQFFCFNYIHVCILRCWLFSAGIGIRHRKAAPTENAARTKTVFLLFVSAFVTLFIVLKNPLKYKEKSGCRFSLMTV